MRLIRTLRTLLKLEVLEARHLPATTAGLACGLLGLLAPPLMSPTQAAPPVVQVEESGWQNQRSTASAPSWLDEGHMPIRGGMLREFLAEADEAPATWEAGYAIAL